MKILVTGGAGFIGSHTCVSLLKEGHIPIIIDNYSNSSPSVLGKIEKITGADFPAYEGDLLNPADLEKVFAEQKPEAVIHFAALKAVGESVKYPLLYYHNNITGTINLLKAMAKHSCETFVFSSSATVYGNRNMSPLTENMRREAINPYGQTKVTVEEMLEGICAANPDFSAISLRYFNPIGADKSGLIGESPKDIPNNLFPIISKVATGEIPELTIFGNDYDTIDGTGVRDYIHVSDLAEGHLAAVRYAAENKGFDAINLGTGKGTSVLELVSAFEKASGKEIPFKFAARRPGDAATCFAGCDKAKEKLGFKARFGIDEMCADGWNFILRG